MHGRVIIKTEKEQITLEEPEADTVLEAVRLVLESQKASLTIINAYRIDVIDERAPKNFSYAKTALEALDKGLKSTVAIAKYILDKRKSCS